MGNEAVWDGGEDNTPAMTFPSETPLASSRKRAKAEPFAPMAVEPRIRIRLEENDGIPPTGQFFSLNGRTFLLRPGEEADVPIGIVNILNDAIMSVPTVDPATMQVTGYRNRQRFPYAVITSRVT